MAKLSELFNDLSIPKDKKSNSYVAHPIQKKSPHRIAKNSSGNPCILISVENSKNLVSKNIRLYNLSIVHNLQCRTVKKS